MSATGFLFGAALREERIAAGMNQSDLARLATVSQSAVSRAERAGDATDAGTAPILLRIANAIARAGAPSQGSDVIEKAIGRAFDSERHRIGGMALAVRALRGADDMPPADLARASDALLSAWELGIDSTQQLLLAALFRALNPSAPRALGGEG